MSCLSCVDSQGRSVPWILMERTGIIVSKPYLITSVSSNSFPSHDLSDVRKLDQGIPIKNRPTLLTLLGRLSLDLMILRFGFEASRVDSCSWNGAHYILRPTNGLFDLCDKRYQKRAPLHSTHTSVTRIPIHIDR